MAFLRGLLRHLRGKVVVIWDGGPNHHGPVLREFLKRNKRLRLERLPPYASDLKPVEAVWSWLKWGRLAHFVPDELRELDDWGVEHLIELKHDPELLRALCERSDLPFPDPPPLKPPTDRTEAIETVALASFYQKPTGTESTKHVRNRSRNILESPIFPK